MRACRALCWHEAARQVGVRGPISARAPGRALRRRAAAVKWARGPVSARRRSACLGARAGSGGRRLLVGRPGCVCGLPVSWRSLFRHARRPSRARAPESAARPFRAPGEPGGSEAEPRASWRLFRDPRNVRRLGVIRGTAVYGFIPGEDYRMRVLVCLDTLALVCLDTLALSSPPERHKHTPWPPHARQPPPSPKRPHPGAKRSATPPRRAIFCHGGVRAPKP